MEQELSLLKITLAEKDSSTQTRAQRRSGRFGSRVGNGASPGGSKGCRVGGVRGLPRT